VHGVDQGLLGCTVSGYVSKQKKDPTRTKSAKDNREARMFKNKKKKKNSHHAQHLNEKFVVSEIMIT